MAHIVDHMFQEYYKITEKRPVPTQKNVKNTARNIMRRRIERKVLEQGVGDPLFARYISQFGTTIPRRPINANLKKTSPNLFKGGKTRRSASRRPASRRHRNKRSTKTRKN